MGKDKTESRLGEERYNKQGCLMKIIEYHNCLNIIVEFQDEYKHRVHTRYSHFLSGNVRNNPPRINKEKYNNEGCLMRVVEYNDHQNIVVEFQDEYKTRVHTQYIHFLSGNVRNPYFSSVYGVGKVGNKYPITLKSGRNTKEYNIWKGMLCRCFDKKFKDANPTYKDATCCKEWLLFENFYEWLHKQDNFSQWHKGERWALDKDIIFKGNKTYSSENCCLVPLYVNGVFIKCNKSRGLLPIGVTKKYDKFQARCMNPLTKKSEDLGTYHTPTEAFLAYKKRKEEIIKEVAEIEYRQSNITKECYEAMMRYEVEIDD